ncbi:hypothetical protein COU14_03560 [Candidatus Kaiserbacteria bacterium CG10_big_fil_rev_8_21_14_0_10_44_10]|uniref:DOD-type homing endonuclease domain-containing protein n=1 Tax=Candidatus Kaiserbacteria bacterium CG10_big_fil_rev_8_21_14_0_10_44_10 TaxID=1974606 RepID=A0A2H0UGP5_9BACT|nr:MAG: hypothetical protein COU14_03560 [Candidatus Kaiserbacteria bacterium CG10_big_fil_rev_8_21_14_0_10_44_10]
MSVQKKVNQNFFKEWTSEMAYVLGFFAADGNMVKSARGGHYFAFYGADREILVKMQEVMESNHKLSKRSSSTGSVYRFQVGSKLMYEDLLGLGFSGNKASRMTAPTVPHHLIGDFVRGYFDGDGNVWVGTINNKRATPTRVIQVSFTSGSRAFLIGLHLLLRQVGIKGGCIYSSKSANFSRLQLSVNDALKLAEIMYNDGPKLFLKRKKLRFEQFKEKRAVVV